jgi:hypothetical protein
MIFEENDVYDNLCIIVNLINQNNYAVFVFTTIATCRNEMIEIMKIMIIIFILIKL